MPGLGVGIAVGITPGGGAGFPYYGLICLLDSALGVATAESSIPTDPATWTSISNLKAISDQGGGVYNIDEDAATGSHSCYQTYVFGENHPIHFEAQIKRSSGTRDFRLRAGAGYATFDPGGAGVGNQSGCTGSISGPDGSGFYTVAIDATTTSTTIALMYLANGLTNVNYAGDNSSGYLVTGITATQVRVETISSQSPATGPYATNANLAEQPYYGDGSGGLVFDGVDDSLKFAAPLGSHTSHTMYFRLSLAAGAGDQYILEAETGPLVVGRNSGTLGVYDGSWHEVQGAAGTDALSDALVEVVLDGVAGTMVVTIDGVAATLDDATYTPVAVNGAGTLGSNYSQDAAFAEMTLYDLVLYSRVLNTAERTIARTELSA
jgi:hypothetical protein